MAGLLGTVQTPLLHSAAHDTIHGDSFGCAVAPNSSNMQMAAPPQKYKNEERANSGEKLQLHSRAIWVSNLPPGTTYQQLKSHAFKAGTAPVCAVVYKSPNDDVGAIGFKTPEEASNAGANLYGSLFQGTRIATDSWENDRGVHRNAAACRYGRKRRGRLAYCIFQHSCASAPSDSIRRRSARIGGAVVDDVVVDDIQTVLDN